MSLNKTADAFNFYTKATDFGNYPENPFGDLFREIIQPEDTVADLGCGFGVVSQYLGPLCRRVISIDKDLSSLEILKKQIKKKNIQNIDIVQGRWPETPLSHWDVTVATYHYHFAYTKQEIDELLAHTRRSGLITCQNTSDRESFHNEFLRRLGLPVNVIKCENGCYVKGRMEQAGLKVRCDLINHDFSQPVDSNEEAVKFIASQLHLDNSYLEKVSRYTQDFIENRGGRLVLPIKRKICVLVFEKT